MYLALRGSSVIHPGTMYDAGPFLTTGDIIHPCKVQHRVKLLVDPKQTVQTAWFDTLVRELAKGPWERLRHWAWHLP